MQAILFSEIEKLGVIYRQAIRMCALEQISQEETAKALQVTVPAIKTRVFHAKRRLRGALAKRMAAPQN
jgi:DNA-directed RNA polymerase specialized sigma24 family protein